MEKIKYIENNPVNGIKYDYRKITKKYKSLGIPPEYDFCNFIPIEDKNIIWYNLNSERSIGKTTNLLLYGMCMNILYGTQIQLIRHHIDKASYYERLFKTIIAYNKGQYIRLLTDGKYNSVRYHWRNFYYCTVDEHGKVKEQATEPFCVALAADDCYTLCSTYESPFGDFIILDECFNESNRPDEFLHFVHLHKTIVRERISDKIFIVGNTIDVNNIWYRQLCIQNQVRKLKIGENKIIYTPENMPIYVAFLDNKSPKRRQRFNMFHYGFGNSELNSITGNGWNIKQYPLTCELQNREQITRGIFMNYHDELFMELELINCDSGVFFAVHPSTYLSAKNGDIQYTLHFAMKENQVYFGKDRLSMKILDFIRSKKVVYADNETGNLFEKFVREAVS